MAAWVWSSLGVFSAGEVGLGALGLCFLLSPWWGWDEAEASLAETHRLSPWQLPAASWARTSSWKVSDKAVLGDGATSDMHLPAQCQVSRVQGCGSDWQGTTLLVLAWRPVCLPV